MTLGEKLRRFRDEREATQEQTAQLLGLTRTTYASYEQDKHMPDYALLIKVAKLYDTNLDYLLGNTEIAVSWDTFLRQNQAEPRGFAAYRDYTRLEPEDRQAVARMIQAMTENHSGKKKK